MLKRLENKNKMFNAVNEVINRNKPIWQDIAAMVNITDEFSDKLSEIDNLRQQTEGDTTGGTREKEQLEGALVDKNYEISSALFAMSIRNNNAVLKEKVDYTESELQQARDGELVATGETISALARENLEPLGEYGVDEAAVTELEELTAQFKAAVPAPRATIAERKAANEKLKKLFTETQAVLENQLDRLMVRFKNSNPDFYSAYMNARVIVDYGIRHETQEP